MNDQPELVPLRKAVKLLDLRPDALDQLCEDGLIGRVWVDGKPHFDRDSIREYLAGGLQ